MHAFIGGAQTTKVHTLSCLVYYIQIYWFLRGTDMENSDMENLLQAYRKYSFSK